MLIKDLYKAKKPVKSFEIFPPKKDADEESIVGAIKEIAALQPDFISVTYSAGGSGGSGKTAELAQMIEENYGVASIAHLTCINAEKSKIDAVLQELKNKGVHNILALRGDLPPGVAKESVVKCPYENASDLLQRIAAEGSFCAGGACYPEGHMDSESLSQDIDFLKFKQDCVAEFLISQLFFDNERFLMFLNKARQAGVKIPISAGIMPIFSRSQIERMIFMCGVSLPAEVVKFVHKFEGNTDDLRKAGLCFAIAQARYLINEGVDGVHIYTMNKPDAARKIFESV
jgi:methylenetetrahydrofolate reductase (NADPH)